MSQVTGNSANLAKKMYNSLKGIYAPDPLDGGPNRQCVVLKTGSTIVPDDYTGSDGKAHLARLFDEIPKINTAWEPSGSTVSTHWKILVTTGHAPPASPPTPEQKREYVEAIKKLYGSEKAYNEDKKSDFYKSVDLARNEVMNKTKALGNLRSEIIASLSKPYTQDEYDEQYQEMAPMYIEAIQTAEQDLSNRLRAVNKYEAAIFSYNTNSLESFLQMLRNRISDSIGGYKRVDSEHHEYYEVYASPSNWATYFKKGYKATDGDGWAKITVSQQIHTTSSSDDTYKDLGGGGFLFTYTTLDDKETKSTMQHDEGVTISFSVKSVEISRPWMDTSVLHYEGITLDGASKGQWSDGVLAPSNTGSFPLLPTTMILAADVSVSASSYSSETRSVIESIKKSPGGLLKFFWFSNKTSVDHSKSASWNEDDQTMTIAGVQILGYSCALMPFFPKSVSQPHGKKM